MVTQNVSEVNLAEFTNSGDKMSLEEDCFISGETDDRALSIDEDPVLVYTGSMSKALLKYYCNECGKIFTRKSTLVRHCKSHQTGYERCLACNMYFDSIDLLFAHNEKFHSAAVECSICKLRFKRKSSLGKHMRTLHPLECKGLFPCEYKSCTALFESESELSDHLNVHNCLKPHICKHCGKMFALKTSLQRHVVKHFKETRSNQCDECGKTFRGFGAYYNHKQSVHRQVRFTCAKCNKEFKYKTGYTKHLQKHALDEQKYGEMTESKTDSKLFTVTADFVTSAETESTCIDVKQMPSLSLGQLELS